MNRHELLVHATKANPPEPGEPFRKYVERLIDLVDEQESLAKKGLGRKWEA